MLGPILVAMNSALDIALVPFAYRIEILLRALQAIRASETGENMGEVQSMVQQYFEATGFLPVNRKRAGR
jgi:hypothetical protein